MPNRTVATYDRWAPTYDINRNPHIVLEHDDVVSLVDARPGEDILDAACGTGKYTTHFHAAGARVIGIDLSPGMLERAIAKFPEVSFRIADISERLPFENDRFDKVNCAQALKHLANLAAVFGEFSRVLKPGGNLVFSVTHPDMTWDDYEVADSDVRFDIRTETDMYQHRFCDYFSALEQGGLTLDRVVQVPVGERIRALLTPASFSKVEGRFQILAIKARKA